MQGAFAGLIAEKMPVVVTPGYAKASRLGNWEKVRGESH